MLDHTGTDVDQHWRIYLAYPADRTVDCKVVQIKQSRNFTDCEKRTIAVEQLAIPPAGVAPIVSADGKLTLDLLPDTQSTGVTTTSAGA